MTSQARWTAPKMEELRVYREMHTLSECAAFYGISKPRCREILKRYASLLYSRTMRYEESRIACGFRV